MINDKELKIIKLIISIGLLLSTNLFANIVDKGLDAYKKGNVKLASELYIEACDNENMLACTKLGILYFTGEGVKQNRKKAEKLFTTACKRRYAKACFRLGLLYKEGGDGIKTNKRKAKLSFGRACNIGSEKSCVQYHILDKQGF